MTSKYYDFNDFVYKIRGDGYKSKRYKHWCSQCGKDRGYAYKNKILKEQFCHKCKMSQPDVLQKISKTSKSRKHSSNAKQKISKSLYGHHGTNPLLRKIARNLRSRLNKAIRGEYKTGSAVRDLGCSIAEFKVYLESKWQDGMNWDNYGQWHIDHIKPLSKFNLTDPEELKKACYYTNLQPMWETDNLRKSSKY